MNRNGVIAILSVIAIIVVGVLISNALKTRGILPGGPMSQTPTPTTMNPNPSTNPVSGRPQVTIKTTKGDIVIELRPDLAPKTVTNYLQKWTSGYCEGKTFHRVEDWVIQGCDPKGDGTGGNSTLPTETSSASFVTGAVGVARKASPKEWSNDSQFFIVKKDSTFLDGDYTYFGQVISGMDVVNKIAEGDKISTTQVLTK